MAEAPTPARRPRAGVTLAAIAVTAAAALPAPVRAQPPAPSPVMDVWILDIGQGACVYVDCPNDQAAILVDCGTSRSSPRISSEKVARWVDGKLAAKPFNTVVLSHAHTDHYSELGDDHVSASQVDQVFLGGRRDHYDDPGGKPWLEEIDRWLDDVPGAGSVTALPARTFVAADTRFRCAPATVDILTASVSQSNPQPDYSSRENNNSVILRVSYGGRSIVLPGDSESSAQDSAMQNARDNELAVDQPTVMLGVHHGSSTHGSNQTRWRRFWKPPIAVFSANIKHGHGHPTCDRLNLYGTYATPVSPSFRLRCGEGANTDRYRTIRQKLLSTYDNGHLRLRYLPGGIEVACEIRTPACDEELSAAELPS